MSLGLYSMREAWESTRHDPPRQALPTCSGPAQPAGLRNQPEGERWGSSYFNNSFIEIQFTCHPGRPLKESTSVVSAHSQICATIITIGFRTFSSTQKGDLMLLSCDSSSPQTPSSWQHQVTYVQTGLFWKVRTNGTTQCVVFRV